MRNNINYAESIQSFVELRESSVELRVTIHTLTNYCLILTDYFFNRQGRKFLREGRKENRYENFIETDPPVFVEFGIRIRTIPEHPHRE